MTYFYESFNLSLLSSKEHIKSVIKDPTPFRNLHVLLNSNRVPSFFRRILDTFKHDRFLLNLKLKFFVIEGTHPKRDQEPPILVTKSKPEPQTPRLIRAKAELVPPI